jgi:thiamine biosynthesis lipoprotein
LPAVASGATSLTGLSGDAFGTSWTVSLPASSDVSGLSQKLDALLANLDLAFSPWRAASVVSRFNTGVAREMVVPGEVADVTRTALEIAQASDGFFDPTVGPLVARWGFGPIDGHAARTPGWSAVSAGNAHIAKAETGLTLDLCGIAKGHALDQMVALLLEAGHENFLVDMGGELAARGRHPSGRPWQVGVEHPFPGRDGIVGVLRLDRLAVATSGDRINGYDIGQRRYSHIIDPLMQEPVNSALASVSVLMRSAREADGWATALMAEGEAGPERARRHDIAALFLFRNGAEIRTVATGAFLQHFVEAG